MATLLYIILAALLSCANNLNITLKDVSYKDYTTSCTNDPIGDFDLVEVTFLVDYSKEPYVNYVIFQRKRTSETRFIFLTGCNIKENCDGSQNAYGRQIGKDHTEITIRINAKSVLSGAKLRGLVYTPENMAITSSEIIFPNITEFTDVEGKLIVNGKTMTPSTDYREVITQPELNLVFLCESQVSPCLIEISTNDSNETSQGAGNATWTKKYPSQSEVHVMIKYGLCNLFGNSKSISCKFHIEYKSTSNENASSNNAIVWTVCISMTMTLLCVRLLKYQKNKIRFCHGPRSLQTSKCLPQCHSETAVPLVDIKKQADEVGTDIHFDSDMETNAKNKSARRRRPVTDTLSTETAQMRHPVIDTYCTEPNKLMQDFTSCQKKGKHERFIPIFKFSKEDLPLMYGRSDIFDLIKCIAELTVKVTVNYTSNKRPWFYPGTERNYPFHEKRGHFFTKLGTGLVKNVIRIENGQTCPCYKCLYSGNASKIWGQICIATAKSLVFDDSEAQKTIFKINFDEENGRYHYVEGSSVTQSDIHTDQCEVECVTCDEVLLNLLYFKPNKCMQKMAVVNSKYNTFKDKEKLTIIVSHPHGCPKHVSIGHWTKRFVVGHDGSRQYTQYVYSTPTCLGCIGAFVYILGASDIALKHHAHYGVNKEMNNFSSIGIEKICTETF